MAYLLQYNEIAAQNFNSDFQSKLIALHLTLGFRKISIQIKS
jgi:hypothetical protein